MLKIIFGTVLNIKDFVTEQDIFSELFSNDNNFVSSEANDRQTPQPVSTIYLVYNLLPTRYFIK